MIDLESYRRRIGCFCPFHRKVKKRKRTGNKQSNTTGSHFRYLRVMTVIFIATLFATCIWTDNDSRHDKNRQRLTHQEMKYESNQEKNVFNKLRDVSSKLVRAKSHLEFFTLCEAEKIFPKNLEIHDHLQIAFESPAVKNSLKAIDESCMLEKIHACIVHYRSTTAELRETKLTLLQQLRDVTSSRERCEYLLQKNDSFSSRLQYQLKKTKKKKAEKLRRFKSLQTEQTSSNVWISDLRLTSEHRETISGNEELDDFIIFTALSLLQKEYPSIVVQPPALFRTTGYIYCPYETLQIAHNDANHWLLLSSLNGVITIYDSLNMRPTDSLKTQMKQLFSPDDQMPAYQQKKCHKQVGGTDCGLFAIAYAVGMFHSIQPDQVIYDQSKMRAHLLQCFENQALTPFPIFRANVNNDNSPIRNSSSEWKVPRRSARLARTSKADGIPTSRNSFEVLASQNDEREETISNHEPAEIVEPTSSVQNQPASEKTNPAMSPPKSSSGSILVNLSNVKLTEDEKSVLEKGLNFGVAEKSVNKEALLDDVYKFTRKLKLRAFFNSQETSDPPDNSDAADEEPTDDSSDSEERADMSGNIKNPYWNPSKSPPNPLMLYIAAVKESIKGLVNAKVRCKDNLSENERIALSNLKEREDIVIQQADKGGKIVIMNKHDYIQACSEMLRDEEFYQREESDKKKEFIAEIKECIDELSNHITDKEARYLGDDLVKPRTPLFYGLPKDSQSFRTSSPYATYSLRIWIVHK